MALSITLPNLLPNSVDQWQCIHFDDFAENKKFNKVNAALTGFYLRYYGLFPSPSRCDFFLSHAKRLAGSNKCIDKTPIVLAVDALQSLARSQGRGTCYVALRLIRISNNIGICGRAIAVIDCEIKGVICRMIESRIAGF